MSRVQTLPVGPAVLAPEVCHRQPTQLASSRRRFKCATVRLMQYLGGVYHSAHSVNGNDGLTAGALALPTAAEEDC